MPPRWAQCPWESMSFRIPTGSPPTPRLPHSPRVRAGKPPCSSCCSLPLHLLRQVTCESDSQVGPALPAVPGECDSSTFPVTHPSHPSSGQQAQSLGSHTPAFLTLPKNPCTSSSRESTLPPRRYQHFPTVTQRRSSTAEGGPRSPGTQPASCLFPKGSPLPGLPLWVRSR